MSTDVDSATGADAESGSGFLSSLPVILWERRWLVLVPFVLIAAAAAAAAFLLPRSYRSSATLLVESQNMPGDTATTNPGDTVIDRRIAKIRQQVLSRPDLVDLIQTNNLYDAASRSQPLSVLVEKMRDSTNISAVDADIKNGGAGRPSAGSIAFSLTFDYPAAAQAQLVAQTFVDRLLKLDATETQTQAATNVNFLQDQESGLKSQVDQIETQINHITGQNGAALASSTSVGAPVAGGDYDGQIATLQRQNVELQASMGSTGIGRDPNVLAAQANLAAARAQYSDDHPDVKLAESRLAAAKATASAFQSNNASPVVQRQIAANNASIARFNSARSSELGRAATMAAAQARGPVVAQQVAQLQAKADALRANLARVSTSLLNARSMSKLAEEQRGERLTLIDPPITPDMPSSPNRPLLVIGGLLGGLVAGVALALLAEFIASPIRSVGALTRLTGAPPLAVVPVLSRRRLSRRAAKRRADAATA